MVKTFVLEQTGSKKDIGTFDPTVFKGGNALSVVVDPKSGLWNFKMDRGLVPGALRNKYTSFNAAFKHVRDYLATKSIIIKEVL